MLKTTFSLLCSIQGIRFWAISPQHVSEQDSILVEGSTFHSSYEKKWAFCDDSEEVYDLSKRNWVSESQWKRLVCLSLSNVGRIRERSSDRYVDSTDWKCLRKKDRC